MYAILIHSLLLIELLPEHTSCKLQKDNISVDIYLKKNSKNSMWFTMLWLNRCNRIVTCKERIEHHTLVQSYLDIFRSWQTNKNYNTQLRINKNAQILFHSSHARIRDQRDSCHKKKLPCISSPLRGGSAVRPYMMQRKRKTEDKKAALLCYTLLWGILRFDSTKVLS